MGKLFLSGGGDRKNTEKFDEEFQRQIGQAKPLLYIPIAMNGMIPYADCLQWMRDVFNPLGIHEIVMWTDLHKKSVDDLQQFSAVYIGGGNTFHLLNEMRSTGFDKVLEEYIKGDGVVYGGSAGAIMLGSNIMTSAHLDENKVGVHDFSGLDVLDGLAVWCHYENENDEMIRSYISDFDTPLIALPEESGAYFQDGHIKVTGTKSAYLFIGEDKVELQPGAEFNFSGSGEYDGQAIFGEKRPFNDAVGHMQSIEGYPAAGDYRNLETMPKALQIGGYLFVGLMVILFVSIVVVGWVLQ
ncbi:Type 1 glutamine amidotransferase-like domain-containing protein [Planomicrobium sp. Y74]|uniref:Type 1 glutamine amidotransferase-like domain-containing protein n=1 Tax=Planomicrobium sp. Y74 TaxID=2478977 RepID=UPI000EF48E5D|nr:Type 1 glutamine amidotransferase-like domain-containing protein [Planomicrobium sp. Y74]RLQ89910.1 peptidase E [Planomicrobium sp. Y74]